MKKEWQLYETNEEEIQKISKKYNVNKLIALVISNRKIKEKDIPIFLSPTRNDFHNPFLMPDMEKAVDRILKAIKNKEKVIIYGDYDVDGITSTTVLKRFLEDHKLLENVGVYIPNRLEEGYGLNKDAIEKISNEKYNLMITVDCGITGVEEIEYAKKLGIETIVTDHHEVGEILPDAIAVVDCKRKDNQYPCRDLAGVGVAFKLIQALSIKLELKDDEYLKYLDIVCIGTISDIVPLVDENRVITKLGLMLVRQTKNMGLKSLLISSGFKKIDSTTISFGIAPKINACGRMGHAFDALNLFLSNDIYEVNELTKKLNEYNSIRQEKERKIYQEAIEQIESKKLYEKNVIVVGGKNWHHGVIGIVSSKITDFYFKPSILLCYEKETAKGSGRSIPGFDLHDALMQCSDTIEKFGGHSMAIGITLNKENVSKFADELENIAEKEEVSKITPIIKIDGKLSLSEINREVVESINLLEPFGEGNRMPIFLFKNLKIDSIRSLSNGKHIKMTLKENNDIIDAICFNMENLSNELKIGDKIDVVGTLEINTFNGVDTIQINIQDTMKSL